MTQSVRRLWLIRELLKENSAYNDVEIPSDEQGQRILLRALMNVRMSQRISDEFLKIQDEYLKELINENGIVELDELTKAQEGIYLWQGDITRLRVDAIVNAANSGMTGCYAPNHRCIDNCIHSYAGIQLRLKCADIMARQDCKEPTGKAKITSAYNLPCRYVIHTVGPIISGRLSKRDCELLASCYSSCLELATQNGLTSIAFCCISTGEFHFPNDRAAEIAVDTVKKFMQKESSVKKVVFNVFKDIDREIYEGILKE